MNIIDLVSHYSDEESCRVKLREVREKQGIICAKCGCEKHYWKKDKSCWECKSCSFRTSLKRGTIMHDSKLPLRYWFIAIGMICGIKKGMSAKELQRQLGHKRYEPIWAMLHKIRIAMGKRDSMYQLEKVVEIDHAFFTASGSDKDSNEKDLPGGNTSKKKKVMVFAQVEHVDGQSVKNHKPNKKVSYIKMVHVDDIKIESVNYEASKHLNKQTKAITDNHKSFKKLLDVIEDHIAIQCFDKAASSELMPWVNIAISNAKRWILGIHHNVKPEYFQNYLNEFCYKFNRRYFDHILMERALIAATTTRWNV